MSALSLGYNISISVEEAELHIDRYHDGFSSYWSSAADVDEVLDILEGFDVPGDSRVTLEYDSGAEKMQYENLEERRLEGLEFLAVYTGDYVVSWEDRESVNEIGLRSRKVEEELLVEMFEATTEDSVSEDDEHRISEFLSRDVE
jgi:hypothetical protein